MHEKQIIISFYIARCLTADMLAQKIWIQCLHLSDQLIQGGLICSTLECHPALDTTDKPYKPYSLTPTPNVDYYNFTLTQEQSAIHWSPHPLPVASYAPFLSLSVKILCLKCKCILYAHIYGTYSDCWWDSSLLRSLWWRSCITSTTGIATREYFVFQHAHTVNGFLHITHQLLQKVVCLWQLLKHKRVLGPRCKVQRDGKFEKLNARTSTLMCCT